MTTYNGAAAAPLVKTCRSVIRYLSVTLRDKLYQEGLWPDLMQEMEIVAWEAGQKGLSEQDSKRLAARRLHAFLKAYGYVAYRNGYFKPDRPFSSAFASMPDELQEIIYSKARTVTEFMSSWTSLKDPILTTIRASPEGISKRDLCLKLRISRWELDWQCRPLVEQGLVRVMNRHNRRGRPLTPLLVDASVRIPEEAVPEADRDEEILQRHLAGMGVKRIARELHHSRKTVTRVIRAMRRSEAA